MSSEELLIFTFYILINPLNPWYFSFLDPLAPSLPSQGSWRGLPFKSFKSLILLPSPFGEGLGVRLFFPLISLNFSFGFSEMLRARWNYNEGSLSQRRRLADSMANVRQLVESKGAVQSVHTSPPSVPPRGRSLTPSPSPKGEGSRMWRVKRGEWSDAKNYSKK